MNTFKQKTSNIPENSFYKKNVLITGATGFVGNRLAEVLSLEYNANVYCIVRQYGNAFKLSRLNVILIRGDVLDLDILINAAKGMDYIIHCAYGNMGTISEMDKVNIEGTSNICLAASMNNVKRLIFLSTISTFAFNSENKINELTPKVKIGDPYAMSKIKAEEIVNKYVLDKLLPAVILQPTAIYGPWAPSYGLKIIRQSSKHRIPLPENGEGICNLIYIDDLVQAILLTCINEKAIGQSYVITSDDQINWLDFYTPFENLLKNKFVHLVGEKEIKIILKPHQRNFLLTIIKSIEFNKSVIKAGLNKDSYIYRILKFVSLSFSVFRKNSDNIIQNSMKRNEVEPATLLSCNADYFKFYSQRNLVSNRKIKLDCNFKPNYSYELGFSEFSKWFNWFYNKNSSL